VIGAEGEKLGLMPIEKALTLAREQGTDLVEVSPKATPPVCKLMDYGKYIYRLKKQEQQQRKKSKKAAVKGIRLGMSIGEHDFEVKRKQAQGFLEEKSVVKVVMIFRGRELQHKALGREKMMEFAKALADIADIESLPKHAGFQTVMVLSPKKGARSAAAVAPRASSPLSPAATSSSPSVISTEPASGGRVPARPSGGEKSLS
jgi:translation initiation factor IF-3